MGVAVGDFNADDRPDVAAADWGMNSVAVLLNDGIWSPPPPVLPTLSILDGSVREGSRGSTSLNLTVTLSKISTDTVTVDYKTSDGTALKNSDYYATHSTLTLSPGQTSRSLKVLIKPDRKREPNETFTVTLSNAVKATIADGVGHCDDSERRLSSNNGR